MKILIGTPIHEIKDYAIKKWLKSVSELENHNWKLLMVNNSENKDWHKRVIGYCNELNFSNFDLVSLPDMKDGEGYEAERLAFSREEIRRKLLDENYDYWFSWECDILCPPQILDFLLNFTDEFDAVFHTYPPRGQKPIGSIPDYQEQDGIGCALFHRRFLYDFKFADNGKCLGGDGRLLFEIIRKGYKVIDIHNKFNLEHLWQ